MPGACDAFHDYQLDWRPDSITIGVDGHAYMRVRNDQPGGRSAWPFDAPFHLILWSGTGICQIWDDGVPGKPFPSDYKAVSKPVKTFDAALAVKAGLMKKGVCKL